MVTEVLSSPNRSVGWAQAGTGFVGFAIFAGFAACIALLASAGVVGGSERGAREDAVLWERQDLRVTVRCFGEKNVECYVEKRHAERLRRGLGLKLECD